MMRDQLIDELATNAHSTWSRWTYWMMNKWNDVDGEGVPYQECWKRLIDTPYAGLKEVEKSPHIREAHNIIALPTVQEILRYTEGRFG